MEGENRRWWRWDSSTGGRLGPPPNDYDFGLAEETLQGQRVAYLRSIVRPAHSFGAFCQTIAAENYRGNGSGSQRP